MSGVISESYLSRPFEIGVTNSRELVYTITETDDETEVQALLFAQSPGIYQGLSRDGVSAEPQGNGVWTGYAKYSRVDDNSEYTFETGGGTTKRTQSLGTQSYGVCTGVYGDYDDYGYDDYAGDNIPPDFGGAIGVNGDTVEGVDITTPNYEFTETHLLADALVTQAYKLILFNSTGTINNATFKGFASGECLFLGASGNKRGDEQWSITYRFACSPNVTNLTLGEICGINKLGWDYIWLRYEDQEDEFAFCLVQRPRAAYVERVYQFSNFATLGIGTT